MKNDKRMIALVICILFQTSILIGEYLGASIPLWTGKEIKVKTVPVDPRSLFRGNYARLEYEFSRVGKQELERSELLRNGEIVYARLHCGNDGIYSYSGISPVRPKSGIFLRGRVTSSRWDIRIRYGIEAFFAPKEKALELEKRLAGGAIAVISVSDSGKSALVDVLEAAE